MMCNNLFALPSVVSNFIIINIIAVNNLECIPVCRCQNRFQGIFLAQPLLNQRVTPFPFDSLAKFSPKEIVQCLCAILPQEICEPISINPHQQCLIKLELYVIYFNRQHIKKYTQISVPFDELQEREHSCIITTQTKNQNMTSTPSDPSSCFPPGVYIFEEE